MVVVVAAQKEFVEVVELVVHLAIPSAENLVGNLVERMDYRGRAVWSVA